jgi:hypothetical protein
MARSKTTFGSGNKAALKHGARSSRMQLLNRDETAAEIRLLLGEHLPYLEPSDGHLLEQAIDVTVQLRLIRAHLDRHGSSLITARGGVRPVASLYLGLHRLLLSCWDRLGVGPRARADIEAAMGIPKTRPMKRAMDAHALMLEKYAPDAKDAKAPE